MYNRGTSKERAINMEDKILRVVESAIKAQQSLTLNPLFVQFLELQKRINDEVADAWKTVETAMIENDIKQLKGDFGTITIAERQKWDIDEEVLPAKFFKKVVNTTKITDTFRLEGKAPKGCTPSTTKYITKRLK